MVFDLKSLLWYDEAMKAIILLIIVSVMVLPAFSKNGQSGSVSPYQTDVKKGKPPVEVRLIYGKDLDNTPIKIFLENQGDDVNDNSPVKRIIPGRMVYRFYGVKPGIYLLKLAFREKGGKPDEKEYEKDYGEMWYIDCVPGGVLKRNEIKVYKRKAVVIDLHMDFEKKPERKNLKISVPVSYSAGFWRRVLVYKKKSKTYFYRLGFSRSINYIDQDALDESNRFFKEYSESKTKKKKGKE